MTSESWAATKRFVFERAKGCCEYCQTCEENTGQAMHVEHINPKGGNDHENLCLSCANCNLSKGIATTAIDPVSNQEVPLFNPRQQEWANHFEWIDNGLKLKGKTDIARATIVRLKMNQQRVIRARRNWIISGNHPPS